MNDSQRAAFALRQKAMAAGYEPYALECGHDALVALCGDVLAYPGDTFAGMTIFARVQPRMAVLARPSRKIGRYEVVPPTRFEAAP